MAGVINAKMSTGTKKPRKLENRPLKVMKMRASHVGKKKLHAMPRTIATTIQNSSDRVIGLEFIVETFVRELTCTPALSNTEPRNTKLSPYR